MSIAAILPRATVKPITANGCPPWRWGVCRVLGREKARACPATARAPRTTLDPAAGGSAAVGSEHDAGAEAQQDVSDVGGGKLILPCSPPTATSSASASPLSGAPVVAGRAAGSEPAGRLGARAGHWASCS